MEILRLDVPDRLSIFQLPPTSTSKGYQLGDWKQQVWEGGLKIFETENDKMIIRFISVDGKQFAQLEVPDNFEDAVMKCEDSVRGFALRLVNPKGGYTWIGLGFRDRNTAFDFRSRIVEFSERKALNKKPTKDIFGEVEDLRLKQGEKISFSFGGNSATAAQKSSATKPDMKLNEFKFGMPADSSSTASAPVSSFTSYSTKPQQSATAATSDWENSWGNFDNATQSQNQKPATTNTDFFADFSDFSATSNSQTSNSNAWSTPTNEWGGSATAVNQQPQWGSGAATSQQQKPSQTGGGTTINLLDL